MPYRFIKVQYASIVDWRWNSNILRATPDFYKKPRFDHALVRVAIVGEEDVAIFVQLFGLFEITYEGKVFKTALVLPLDRPTINQNRRRDKLLRIRRVEPRARSDMVLIDVSAIIRGCLLADDLGSNAGEHLVVEFTDEDMWMRMKQTKLATQIVF